MVNKKIYVPTGEEFVKIHDYLVNIYGGTSGLIRNRDPDYISYFCENYLRDKGVIDVVSFVLSRLSKGHYFIDGNKRTSYFGAKFAAMINDYDFNGSSVDEVVSELSKIAELPEEESREYCKKIVERELVKSCHSDLRDFSRFEKVVLKNIAISAKLSQL